jgi:hypothetical protein
MASAGAQARSLLDEGTAQWLQINARPTHVSNSRTGLMNLMSTPISAVAASAAVRAPMRLDAPRTLTLNTPAAESIASPAVTTRAAFAIHWQYPTEVERLARNFKREGLPVVRLLDSGHSLVALGVSPTGKRGLYFTKKLD